MFANGADRPNRFCVYSFASSGSGIQITDLLGKVPIPSLPSHSNTHVIVFTNAYLALNCVIFSEKT